ncbi:site-specific DNA-methyltransferase [Bradyrhizobium sp. CCGUVB1N3]|uniref:site-specific DNA-methyltransferase n=1 Tax=Bradyrhizobium sp. CCGUVB1N3 TaxID=2949629 RepID=UPI0020B42D0E|nr:DNA methyltransferase [Bradyrhizobium sp. CCGUVB1N3]MCP3472115.1 site-specific DNA-methyltransferase [Bradyrhizobium sp. CCGUVB1N3]
MQSKSQTNGCPLRHDLTPILVRIDELKRLGRETRRHPKAQIGKLAANLQEFGVTLPILIDQHGGVIGGWAVIAAAQQLGLDEIPAIKLVDLTEPQARRLRLAHNRLAQDASWDPRELQLELSEILAIDAQVDLQLTGFSAGEIDMLLAGADDQEDDVPTAEPGPPVSTPGDTLLGPHWIHCGDALQAESYRKLMGDERARMVFADPPYNCKISGHVSGRGQVKHGDFAMASGEMAPPEYEAFLTSVFTQMCDCAVDGSLHFIFSDWRVMGELLSAGRAIYTELKNLCIWNKSNAGMGSLYRSQHELVFVYKFGAASHINNIALGRHGRNRTNVWNYVSQSALSGTSKSKLALHPTVKPVALIADAIRDCTNEHDIVLDPFGGAGTTLIAAERTRRRARLIEIDTRYVDVTIRRWQHVTGKAAVHAETGEKFDQRVHRSRGERS